MRDDLRKEMYEAVILSLLSQQSMTKDSLVDESIKYLSRPDATHELQSRVDALAMKGKILREGPVLKLSEKSQQEIDAATICYETGLEDLKNGVADILQKHISEPSLSSEVAIDLAIHLAKLFASNQSALINRTSKSTVVPFPNVFDVKKNINAFLIEYGLDRNVEAVREELVELASKNLFVKRLVNAVTYAWMEYCPNRCAIIAMGQCNWTKVEIILDANIAIPYLLAKWFGSTPIGCSEAIVTSVDALQKKGCTISLPNIYLSECAGHLVRALKFLHLVKGNEHILKASENAFVSHYCQMFEKGDGECPNDFEQYIKNICNRVFEYTSDMKTAKDFYFNAIKSKFANVLNITSFPAYRANLIDEHCSMIRSAYTDELQNTGRLRGVAQIDHDVVMLNEMLYGSTTPSKILLTSDRVVTAVFVAKVPDNSMHMVVAPGEMCDILQLSTGGGMNDNRLRALALTYATVGSSQELIACKFFDELMECANANVPLWKQTERINALKKKFFESHATLVSANEDEKQAREAIHTFLVSEGLVQQVESDEELD